MQNERDWERIINLDSHLLWYFVTWAVCGAALEYVLETEADNCHENAALAASELLSRNSRC